MKEDSADKTTGTDATIAELQREKETLSQQVKRLIMAETKLYEYQEELDAQLKEYKELYELNKKLDVTLNLATIFECAVGYVVQSLDFERAVFLLLTDGAAEYRVCALDGYYDEEERRGVEQMSVPKDAPLVRSLVEGVEYLICTEDAPCDALEEYRAKLLMHELFLYPIGSGPSPRALLAVGNSAESAEYYRKVSADGALLSMGTFVGLISTSVENRIYYRKMEEALEHERVAEAKYRSIFDNALEGIFQRTPSGRYLAANPALARTLGYDSPHDLIDSVTDIGSQLYVHRESHELIIRLLQEQGAVAEFQTQMYRKDGTVIWVAISARAVRDSAGRLLYYEGTTEEITERKRAEEALRESERKYRQLSEALEQRVQEAVSELRNKDKMLIIQGRQAVMGEMLSNIAHQWRQPLNVLGLLVQDLKLTMSLGQFTDDYLDASVAKSLEIIDGMSRTIDDFRFFFKPDKEKVQFSVADYLEKALSLLDGSFRAYGIEVELARNGNPTIAGYPGEFTQVLLNILINARDALIGGNICKPRICIRVFREGKKSVVTVRDNAGGIPEVIIDKIFEPYFTTKGPEQGTGIGLFMCRNIIEKSMGGVLSARNVEGGAEFRIEV